MLKLRQTLGSSYLANGQDVRETKSALQALGEYTPATVGDAAPEINDWTDDGLFDGLKKIQKKAGLSVDGVAKPGGPTETVINAALSEKTMRAGSKSVFGAPGDNPRNKTGAGTKAGVETKAGSVTKKAARQRNPTSFGLTASLGPGYANRGTDVQGAKRALAWAGYYPRDAARNPAPDVDEALCEGLFAFQRDFGLKRDGIMHPRGQTQTRLDALVTPLIHAAATELATMGQRNPTTVATPSRQIQPSDKPNDAPFPETPPSDPPSDPPHEEEPEEATCAQLKSQIETATAEREQINDDIALLNIPPEESDRNLTGRYVALLDDYGGYSTAPPDVLDAILKVADLNTPGASTDGGASSKMSSGVKAKLSTVAAMFDAVRANPAKVQAAREKALTSLEQKSGEVRLRLQDLSVRFEQAGCT